MAWRVVSDTNVMISGLLWRGAPYRCLQLARTGLVEAFYCPEMLDELAAKLTGKFGFSGERAREALDLWRALATEVPIEGNLRAVVDDPDDDVFVECALRAEAEFLVSGDRHLLALGRCGTTEILSSGALLDRFRGQDA